VVGTTSSIEKTYNVSCLYWDGEWCVVHYLGNQHDVYNYKAVRATTRKSDWGFYYYVVPGYRLPMNWYVISPLNPLIARWYQVWGHIYGINFYSGGWKNLCNSDLCSSYPRYVCSYYMGFTCRIYKVVYPGYGYVYGLVPTTYRGRYNSIIPLPNVWGYFSWYIGGVYPYPNGFYGIGKRIVGMIKDLFAQCSLYSCPSPTLYRYSPPYIEREMLFSAWGTPTSIYSVGGYGYQTRIRMDFGGLPITDLKYAWVSDDGVYNYVVYEDGSRRGWRGWGWDDDGFVKAGWTYTPINGKVRYISFQDSGTPDSIYYLKVLIKPLGQRVF